MRATKPTSNTSEGEDIHLFLCHVAETLGLLYSGSTAWPYPNFEALTLCNTGPPTLHLCLPEESIMQHGPESTCLE